MNKGFEEGNEQEFWQEILELKVLDTYRSDTSQPPSIGFENEVCPMIDHDFYMRYI